MAISFFLLEETYQAYLRIVICTSAELPASLQRRRHRSKHQTRPLATFAGVVQMILDAREISAFISHNSCHNRGIFIYRRAFGDPLTASSLTKKGSVFSQLVSPTISTWTFINGSYLVHSTSRQRHCPLFPARIPSLPWRTTDSSIELRREQS